MRFLFMLCCLLIVRKYSVESRQGDLYDILGVDESASARTIKQAYKQLAKEWHPDRNRSPDANEKFMKINEAYETLSDPQKRQKYDTYGTTSAQANSENQHGSPFQGGFDGFSFHFGQGGPFHFQFQGQRSSGSNSQHKINLWTYENTMLSESWTKPYLIYVYAEFCFQCFHVAPIWEDFVSDLKKLGLGIAVVQADSSPALIRKLKVSGIPDVIGLSKGKLKHFSGSFNNRNLRDFAKSLLPMDTVVTLTDENLSNFLSDWSNNKVKVIMVDNRREACLRFVAASHAHRDYLRAGYYLMNRKPAKNSLLSKYPIVPGEENLLIFKEDINHPVAFINAQQIDRLKMDEMMEEHKYLDLPRVSSASVFDHLCPVQPLVKLRRLCVMLMVWGRGYEKDDEPFISSFRSVSQHLKGLENYSRVSFSYLYENAQVNFVWKIRDPVANNYTSNSRKVVILWRGDKKDVKFDFLPKGWTIKEDEEGVESNRQRLVEFLEKHLTAARLHQLGLASSEPEIVDEFAESGIWTIWYVISDWAEYLYETVTHDDLTISMALGTFFAVIFLFFIVKSLSSVPVPPSSSSTLPRQSSFPKPSNYNHAGKHKMNKNNGSNQTPGDEKYQSLKDDGKKTNIVNLDESKFDWFIPMATRGHRTIVLLSSCGSEGTGGKPSHKMLEKFRLICQAYSSSNFRFRFACLPLTVSHVSWCRQVGRSSKTSTLNTQERESVTWLMEAPAHALIGAVIAVNAHSNCYHLFRNNKKLPTTTNGSFLGLDSNDEDSDDFYNDTTEKHSCSHPSGEEERLLDGLDIWLERLYEGTVPKIVVSNWPKLVDW